MSRYLLCISFCCFVVWGLDEQETSYFVLCWDCRVDIFPCVIFNRPFVALIGAFFD